MIFRCEQWPDFYPRAKHLFPVHWGEIALDRDKIPLDMDLASYERLNQLGNLHIVAALDGERIVGYAIWFLMRHPHYQSSGPMGQMDVYFLLPEFRMYGALLFKESERTLCERGITKIYLSCKLHSDKTALFERLGYRATDKVFTKLLEVG
jgi:hypothetical protein